MRAISEYFKKIGIRRVIMTLTGNVFAGLGIAIFRFSALGNDPYTAMNLSVSDCLGMEYANYQLLFNLCLFVVQLLFGRELIGIGTLVNACLLGYIVNFFYNLLAAAMGAPSVLWLQLIVVFIGVLICTFGLSLYQTADVGVAPYDSLSLITKKYLPKIPYFWHRILDDGIAALVCFLTGGLVGLGTLISAFGFGPFIHFYNEHFSKKLLGKTTSQETT